jgi:hypothetical protein
MRRIVMIEGISGRTEKEAISTIPFAVLDVFTGILQNKPRIRQRYVNSEASIRSIPA